MNFNAFSTYQIYKTNREARIMVRVLCHVSCVVSRVAWHVSYVVRDKYNYYFMSSVIRCVLCRVSYRVSCVIHIMNSMNRV